MKRTPDVDVAIIGGGLAGLSSAILLRRQGYSVALFEKERYPYHKVCGEYISLESRPFLLSLGLPLDDWNLPLIDTLQLTAPNGTVFNTPLPLGGFGISRYKLDDALANLAKGSGVQVYEKTRVDEVERTDVFTLRFQQQSITSRLCFAAYGKRGNLDVKWKRPFLQQTNRRLNNYVGVKYHISTQWPRQTIGLHNFENGYCGISQIEEGNYCLCYLTRGENLKHNGNNIAAMEKAVLYRNLHLQKIFNESEIIQSFPVTISQISFASKSQVEDGVLMLGDTAGMITPLCGNGMSIALHSAKIAATLGQLFLSGKLTQAGLEAAYQSQWQQAFAARLRTGRYLQSFFGSKRLSNLFVASFKLAPFLAKPVIRSTHGEPF